MAAPAAGSGSTPMELGHLTRQPLRTSSSPSSSTRASLRRVNSTAQPGPEISAFDMEKEPDMNQDRFAGLTRSLDTTASRRDLGRALAGGALGTLAGSAFGAL